jgi:hypothetical protein
MGKSSKAKAAAAMAKASKSNGPGNPLAPKDQSSSSPLQNLEVDMMGSGGANSGGFGGEVMGSVNAPVLSRGNTTMTAGMNFGFGGYRNANGTSGFQGAAIPTIGIRKTIGSKKSNSNKKQ